MYDPYNDNIPELPDEIKNKTYNNILKFYNKLNAVVIPKVGIIMGSILIQEGKTQQIY